MFNIEEKLYDVQENKKITFNKFVKKYLDKDKTVMLSKLNNKGVETSLIRLVKIIK